MQLLQFQLQRTAIIMFPAEQIMIIMMQATSAVLNEINLNTFIMLIMMQIEMMSDIIQFLFESHQPMATGMLKRNPIMSIILIVIPFIMRLCLKKSVLNTAYRISMKTIVMLTKIEIQLTTFIKTEAGLAANRLNNPTNKTEPEIIRIHLISYSNPPPLNELNLAKKVENVKMMVAITIMMSCPNQNLVSLQEISQLTLYVKLRESKVIVTKSKQLSFEMTAAQLLCMTTEHVLRLQMGGSRLGMKLL